MSKRRAKPGSRITVAPAESIAALRLGGLELPSSATGHKVAFAWSCRGRRVWSRTLRVGGGHTRIGGAGYLLWGSVYGLDTSNTRDTESRATFVLLTAHPRVKTDGRSEHVIAVLQK